MNMHAAYLEAERNEANPVVGGILLWTRILGGFFLLWGLLSVNSWVQDLVFWREPRLDFNVVLVFLGWGLLRGWNGARIVAAMMFGFFGVMASVLLGEPLWGEREYSVVMGEGAVAQSVDYSAILSLLAIALICFGSMVHLTRVHVRNGHFAGSKSDGVRFWTPGTWIGSVWSWATVATLIACLGLSWLKEPALQRKLQGLGIVSVPAYLDGLPPMPLGGEGPVTGSAGDNGRTRMFTYGYHMGWGQVGAPTLDFVFMASAEGGISSPSVHAGQGLTTKTVAHVDLGNGRISAIPDGTQLFEMNDRVLTRGEMHITFPEFWHYRHTVGIPTTVADLEAHAKQLRLEFGE